MIDALYIPPKPAIIMPRPQQIVRPGDPRFAVPKLAMLPGIGAAFAVAGGSCIEVTDYSSYTKYGNLTGGGGLAAAFDSTQYKVLASSANLVAGTNTYVGVDFGAAVQVCKLVISSSSDSGFTTGGGNVTLTGYGKATAPGSSTDGTSLGTTGSVASANSASHTINVSDTNSYRYVHIQMASASSAVISRLRIWIVL